MLGKVLCAVIAGHILSLLPGDDAFAGPEDDTLRIAAPWEVSALTPSAGTALQRVGAIEIGRTPPN